MNRRALLTRGLLASLFVNEWWRPALAKTSVRVTDAAGRPVAVTIPADRIVVMFNYEELIAIAGPHAFDRVVGYSKTVWYDWRRSIWETYAAAIPRLAQVPDVGYALDSTFSAEKVVALHPDVVIMPRWAFDPLGPAVQQLAGAGIPTVVIDYNAMRVPTHVASTLAIGKVVGADGRARELADLYTAKVADVRARVAKAAQAGLPRPKVYVELGDPGPAEYGDSFVADQWGPLVDIVGGANIAKGQITSEAPLRAEYVLASNPDYIFIAGSTWTNAPASVDMGFGVPASITAARLKPYLDRPGWRDLNAVRNGHVYAIHHGIVRTLFDYTAMQFFGKALYPGQFAGVDPEASLRAYFDRYLPVRYSGTWMLRITS